MRGSKTAASDVDVLSAHSVTHVLNTTVEIPNFHEKRPGAPKYLNLGLQDTKDDDIAAEFERCRDFINSARDSGGVVLVHCQAGISRSATIVISYLMAEKKMSLLEAYRHTKERRSNVGPNERYCEDLGKFEDSLRPESERGQPPTFTLRDCYVEELLAMGFDREKAERAVEQCGGRFELAVNFCLM
eukprot:TRINITY_DN14630_c0_g1_i11.p1 TRINITY_DN14630_c0_g1~~TRINITY_DN14630_c0_g1_i11.p1  ORF type:complete len:187 (+),score=42.36 TRINITY_DN14630_c0_g1_i11:138-698(+)